MMYQCSSQRGALLRALLLVFCLVLTSSEVAAQVRGISYTAAPTVERLYFDGNAGLEPGLLYGGQLGLGFGRFVELQVLYLRGGATTDFSRLAGVSDEIRLRLEDHDGQPAAVQRYGSRLKLNLPWGAARPFLTLGGGLLSIGPEELESSRTIYLSGGGGVQLAPGDRFTVLLGVENVAYGANLGTTFFDEEGLEAIGLLPSTFNDTRQGNWAIRAGLQFYVGGRDPDEESEIDEALRSQFGSGLRGLGVRIEPFLGRLHFHEALGFTGRQPMQGLSAGLSLGPYLGVRGFYWRAVREDVFSVDYGDLQAYGGELHFRLNDTAALTPYLALGGGYLDVLSGYAAPEGRPPDDEPFLVAGGGLALPVGESVTLNGSVRSLLISGQAGAAIRDPDQVFGSWMYTAGATITLGGGGSGVGELLSERLDEERAAGRESDAVLRRDLARALTRLDSLEAVLAAGAGADSLRATDARAAGARVSGSGPARSGEATFVTLPVPTVGELYVRYGEAGQAEVIGGGTGAAALVDTAGMQTVRAPAGALSPDDLRWIVGEAVREQFDAAPEGTDDARLRRLEAELQARLDRLEVLLEDQQRAAVRGAGDPAPATVIVREEGGDREVVRLTESVRERSRPELIPFVGMLTGGPALGIVGIRADVGSVWGRALRIRPEFALGIGADNYAYHTNLDVEVGAPSLGGLRPYAATGVGMLGFDTSPDEGSGVEITLNLRAGVALPVGGGRLFAEFATYDLFDYNRYVAGYQVSF